MLQYNILGTLIAVALLSTALFAGLVTSTVLVLRHIEQRPQRSWPELRALLASLAALADRIATTQAPGTEPKQALPDELHEWVQQESEPWAVEDQTARARELYQLLYDGDEASTWAKVFAHMQKEEEETLPEWP